MISRMPQNGYLVISDISGYSKFLHDSELDHARDSLSDLLHLLVEETRSPLRIVELEGDAVFSYAPGAEVSDADELTAMIEDAYIAFRSALNLMVVNTTCTCKACRLLPTLDLKFFIHFGSFARQDVGEHHKLVGNDVNLVHRLLKNSIPDETRFDAYAAYTEPAVEELRLDRTVEGFVAHAETYKDVGEVGLCVKDMHGVWEAARNKVRIRVEEEEAAGLLGAEFPLEPAEMWPYITDPVTRNMLVQSDWQELESRPDGKRGPGATYVCAHGSSKTLQTIVDWDPPYSYTVRSKMPTPRTTGLSTYELVATEEGSSLRCLWRCNGPFLVRQFTDLIAGRMFASTWEKGIHVLRQRIHQNQAQEQDRIIQGEA